MSYASLAILTDRYGEQTLVSLTDRGGVQTGAIDVATVDRALADTDAVINGYLAERYVLPMASTPPLIADLAQAIAIYKLHVYTPDLKIVEDYKGALRQLEQIGKGTIRLSIEGVTSPETGGRGARLTDRERPFTAANLKGFI